MGYHITLNRPEPGAGITEQEWRSFVASRSELKIVEETPHFVSVILDGDDNLALHYSSGDASVFTKNPEGPRIIEYMASIAHHFGGVVTGDEGETFSSPARGNKSALGNPLPTPWMSRRVATNLNPKRRGAPGSGLPHLDVPPKSDIMTSRWRPHT